MKQDNIRVRAVLRDPPDYKQLARALMQLAAEAQAAERKREEAKARRRQSKKAT